MNGILIMDKPQGITSFGVVAKLRRLTGERRIGHSGTLDPMATGVLPVFLGAATKLISLLPCQDKRYEATFSLGVVTDTGDITGKVLKIRQHEVLPEEVAAAASAFIGAVEQIPPMVSAKKYRGSRLYELAKKGVEVERKPSSITIYSLDLDQISGSEYGIIVHCSKGTYIRTLISDIGEKLGCGAVMTSLRRTYASGFTISQAETLERIEELTPEACLLDMETPFLGLGEVSVTQRQMERFCNGGALSLERLDTVAEGLCRVLFEGDFIGLGEADRDTGELKVRFIAKHPEKLPRQNKEITDENNPAE